MARSGAEFLLYGRTMKLKPYYRIDPNEWMFRTHGDVAAAYVRAVHEPGKGEGHIEEYVRQWVLREIVESYAYPKEWMGERIVVEEVVPVASTDKESDISIKNDRGRTFIYVETKAASVVGPDFERAERQLETYLSSTHTATIGMLTNGITTKIIRKKVNPNDFEYIADIPEHGSKAGSHDKLVRDLSIVREKKGKVGLTPLPQRYQNILFDAHSAMRDIDGLHDDNALDELAKVLYAKIFDERMVSQTKEDEAAIFRFQAYGKGSASEVASEIRDLYKDACDYDLRIYSQRIPGYDRSRGVFREQVGLSDVALARVVEILQDYSIVDAEENIKSAAFQGVLSAAIRAGMGQYFTPDPIVKMAVAVVAPSPKDHSRSLLR